MSQSQATFPVKSPSWKLILASQTTTVLQQNQPKGPGGKSLAGLELTYSWEQQEKKNSDCSKRDDIISKSKAGCHSREETQEKMIIQNKKDNEPDLLVINFESRTSADFQKHIDTTNKD